MKKILFSILCAFMVSTMASAQYLNVKLDDGTYHSYKTTPNMEVSFGEKKGAEVTDVAQTATVNGYKVTVKLADNTPANEVALHTYIEGDKVKIKAMAWDVDYGLECIKDGEVIAPTISADGFYTFTVSDISNDMVVTVGYITVRFDLNNSNISDNFKNTEDIRIGYNSTSTVPRTYASAEKHSFRGWYKDKECTTPWNHSDDKVTKSITLYAKWAEDPTGTQINGHDFVKLGGYYWATVNVGECDNVTAVIGPGAVGNGWGFYYYTQTDNNALNAAKSFGETWTLPSEAQWQALIDYCDWEWQNDYEYNGTTMNGMLVKGRSDTYESGHSIFLPAAGIFSDGLGYVDGQGSRGCYWSTDNRRYLNFSNGNRYMNYYNSGFGMAVRPVSE